MTRPEWMTKTSERIALDGEAQLSRITEEAAARYQIAGIELPQEATLKLACFLNEVQHQSFILGIHLAFSVVQDLADNPPPA